MARTIRKPGVKEELENDPRFLRRVEQARNSSHAGRGLSLEDVETD
jgi:hypothetical protein